MSDPTPTPGRGYVIREYLGGGFWKRAYRASSNRSTADVALLYPHDDTRSDILLKDVANLIRAASQHEFSAYIAQFHGLERGEDGKLFIVEELLDRPLDKLNPLDDLGQFARIARDLCRGLCCLHESKLVHRDLKLDNCGMDQLQRAKIFDLGSVTSELGGIEGTIFTRAPELFDAPTGFFDADSTLAAATPSADVWALGATLFALRLGSYPFVHDAEVLARRNLNTKVAQNKIELDVAKIKKQEIDISIAARVVKKGAFENLAKRVSLSLRGLAGDILLGMLAYNPSSRLTARQYENKWSALCNELGAAGPRKETNADKWDQIVKQLSAISRKEFSLTEKQLERLISEVNDAKLKDADRKVYKDIDALLRQIKSLQRVI